MHETSEFLRGVVFGRKHAFESIEFLVQFAFKLAGNNIEAQKAIWPILETLRGSMKMSDQEIRDECIIAIQEAERAAQN